MKRAVVWSQAAFDKLREQVTYIASDNPTAARRIADQIRATGIALGEFTTGKRGRVTGTYETKIARLPYLISYELRTTAGGEVVVILRVIHTARNWPADGWPE